MNPGGVVPGGYVVQGPVLSAPGGGVLDSPPGNGLGSGDYRLGSPGYDLVSPGGNLPSPFPSSVTFTVLLELTESEIRPYFLRPCHPNVRRNSK